MNQIRCCSLAACLARQRESFCGGGVLFVGFPVVLVVVVVLGGQEAFEEIGPFLVNGGVGVGGVGEIEDVITNTAEASVTGTLCQLPQDGEQRFVVGQDSGGKLGAVEFLGHHVGVDLHESGRSARYFDPEYVDIRWNV